MLVANGININQVNFPSNDSRVLYTNPSGQIAGIDFHYT